MQLNECINFLMTNAQNAVLSYFKQSLKPYNITPIQYALLKCLWDKDGLTPSQLANLLSLDSSTITGILDRVENKGYVKRTYSPYDRRSITIYLTPEGKALQRPIEKVIEDSNAAVMKDMDPEDVLIAKKLIVTITDNALEAIK